MLAAGYMLRNISYFLHAKFRKPLYFIRCSVLPGMKGPEGDMSRDGQYDFMLLKSSAVMNNVQPNNLNDKKLCAKYGP